MFSKAGNNQNRSRPALRAFLQRGKHRDWKLVGHVTPFPLEPHMSLHGACALSMPRSKNHDAGPTVGAREWEPSIVWDTQSSQRRAKRGRKNGGTPEN